MIVYVLNRQDTVPGGPTYQKVADHLSQIEQMLRKGNTVNLYGITEDNKKLLTFAKGVIDRHIPIVLNETQFRVYMQSSLVRVSAPLLLGDFFLPVSTVDIGKIYEQRPKFMGIYIERDRIMLSFGSTPQSVFVRKSAGATELKYLDGNLKRLFAASAKIQREFSKHSFKFETEGGTINALRTFCEIAAPYQENFSRTALIMLFDHIQEVPAWPHKHSEFFAIVTPGSFTPDDLSNRIYNLNIPLRSGLKYSARVVSEVDPRNTDNKYLLHFVYDGMCKLITRRYTPIERLDFYFNHVRGFL